MSRPPAYPGVELARSTPPLIGDAVLAVQVRLAELGLPCADIDKLRPSGPSDIAGLFGLRTVVAVRAFQVRSNLHDDGIVGSGTWGKLFDTAPAVVRLAAAATSAVNPNARDTDFAKLHPAVRARVKALLEDFAAEQIPMGVFEAFRAPERQQALFAQGRDAHGAVTGAVVTNARPFESYHQYGLAVDIVIQRAGVNPWETGTAEAKGWWKRFHELAAKHDLEPLSWELPHVQLSGLTTAGLLRGNYPADGGDSWADAFSGAVERWQGRPKPPAPPRADRPPLAAFVHPDARVEPPAAPVAAAGWAGLPSLAETQLTQRFGGRRWRVTAGGVVAEGLNGDQPFRSDGEPDTCRSIIEQFGPQIQAASQRFAVPPELIVMVIATEVGIYRNVGFTGPKTFRWEEGVHDYSAGPMQLLSRTALDEARRAGLSHPESSFPQFESRPATPPSTIPLYDPALSIEIGGALIRRLSAAHGLDPILLAASYNAGGVYQAEDNPWHLRCYGNHLDRAAQWFGDACAVIATLRS